MLPETVKLVISPHCKGCLQKCLYNGRVMADYKASSQGTMLNKCNTATIQKPKVTEIEQVKLARRTLITYALLGSLFRESETLP